MSCVYRSVFEVCVTFRLSHLNAIFEQMFCCLAVSCFFIKKSVYRNYIDISSENILFNYVLEAKVNVQMRNHLNPI